MTSKEKALEHADKIRRYARKIAEGAFPSMTEAQRARLTELLRLIDE